MSMIERVARALDPWAWAETNGDERDRRSLSLSRAQTAIEAMREPSGALVAMWEKADEDVINYGRAMDPETVWQVTFDFMLKEPAE